MKRWYLRDWNLVKVQMLWPGCTYFVEYKHGYILKVGGDIFLLWDNGGEINVGQVGGRGFFEESMPLPTEQGEEALQYRLSQFLYGIPIDYDYKETLTEEEFGAIARDMITAHEPCVTETSVRVKVNRGAMN